MHVVGAHYNRGNSNECPQHRFLWRIDQNYVSNIIKYPPYLFVCCVCSLLPFSHFVPSVTVVKELLVFMENPGLKMQIT